MANHAEGKFEIMMNPEAQEKTGEITLGRYTIDKQFQGGLEAVSNVQMLAAGSETTGAGAYVALEQVTGTLDGRKGGFVLIHNGTRTKETQQLTVTVVPGCGTGELTGLTGKMAITITGKDHFYDFEYTLG